MPPNPLLHSQQEPNPPFPLFRHLKMPALFNIIRTVLYGVVLLFTLICLAMAGHFQHILDTSGLARFVPFAIFVCSVSMLVFVILLGFSFFLKERNPISTRIELACLGVAAIFWLSLGSYLAVSDAKSADVECFSSSSGQTLASSSENSQTEQYHAMYNVLMTFSLMNAFLVAIFCLGLLLLAIRRHYKGDDHMWYGPVTSCAWFNDYGKGVKRGNSQSSSILPITGAGAASGHRNPSQRRNPYGNGRPRVSPSEKSRPMRQVSGNSGHSTLIGSHSTNEFERGNMINPYMARGNR